MVARSWLQIGLLALISRNWMKCLLLFRVPSDFLQCRWSALIRARGMSGEVSNHCKKVRTEQSQRNLQDGSAASARVLRQWLSAFEAAGSASSQTAVALKATEASNCFRNTLRLPECWVMWQDCRSAQFDSQKFLPTCYCFRTQVLLTLVPLLQSTVPVCL